MGRTGRLRGSGSGNDRLASVSLRIRVPATGCFIVNPPVFGENDVAEGGNRRAPYALLGAWAIPPLLHIIHLGNRFLLEDE